MPEKKENQNTLMHRLIRHDLIYEHVKDESSYLIAREYANHCRESKAEIRLGLV